MAADPRRFLRYLEAERSASLLYRALAETVTGDRREALLELAQIEDEHADHWVDKLNEYGVPVPAAPTSLDPTNAALVARARGAGFADVLLHLEEAEDADAGMYDAEPEAPTSMSDDEREHIEVFQQMRTSLDSPTAAPLAGRLRPRSTMAGESWHRTDKSGSMRAAVFGVSDGLVSNTALVMGFAGASSGNSAVLFAGLAGLLAGAFSMAAGEYVSVASQRDLFRREIEIEATELRDKPEEEQKELELIYRAKGLDRATAASTAAQIMADPKTALDTLAREELGLDPDELGSPVKV
ncbi:MAG: VIT1/CCC1 transporter family protein, partial [Actinobacteria bacterium]|nr:VIT1/CCC1 transporter family protein [Actinomycetota bacterium]